MKHLLLFGIFFGLMACSGSESHQADAEPALKFDFLLSKYDAKRKELYPLQAMKEGDNTNNGELPIDISHPFRKSQKEFYTSILRELEAIKIDSLCSKNQLSYQIIKWECDIKLAELEFPTHLTPLNQFESLHLTMGVLATGKGAQPFNTSEDYRNWARRCFYFADWCDTAISNMRKGIEQGYTLPKPLVEKMIPQLAGFAEDVEPEDHLFFTPIHNLPSSISKDEREFLTNAYYDVVDVIIEPTFQELHDFIVDEYLPNCRNSSGASDLPNGVDYYQNQIKKFTTTTLTADEIFVTGEKEVERISVEMEKIKTQLGYSGSLSSFLSDLRTNPELTPFKSPEEVISNFEQIHKNIIPNVDLFFGNQPKTPFVIKRTESFREKSGSAEYNSGLPDGSRPGIFYVPIPDVNTYNTLSDEDLFLHEAIPGHHFQIMLQMEDTTLPAFRNRIWYDAYGEGWALYSESLGKELGLYEDPYQYFGMLSAEMHRAIRLVVDVGIHSKGWTREQAIAYSLKHEAKTEAEVISEIERYMSWPGQALSYKIGQLKIRELRTYAENELGDKFEIIEFHNEILESGCIPIGLLELKISNWVESKKTTT